MTSLSHRWLSAHNLTRSFSLCHFISRPLVLLSVLLIGAVCVLVAPRVSEGAKQAGSATTRWSSPTHLQGRQALDYLKQQGIYDRLSASIEASSYKVDEATPEANLPH